MSELLKVFDSYLDFSIKAYFTFLYDRIGSSLQLEVPLESKKPNMELALAFINLPTKGFEIVYKNWNTEDSSNADFQKDFAYDMLFKSLNQKALISLTLQSDTLSIDFLYDSANQELEKWIIEENHKLRKEFGLTRTPTFSVLTKSHDYFDTEDVKAKSIKIDLKKNYNDDFIDTYQLVNKAIKGQNSGLILLYGKPGTGKTTYIRSLISEHQNSNFIFVQNEFVNNLLDPDFISFLLKQRNSILIIEDAEKVITSRENLNEGSIVSAILQLTDGLFSDYLNIKVICTFNTSLSKIDSALLRKGRMISMYEFKDLTLEKTNTLLDAMGGKRSEKGMSLSDIYNIDDKSFDNLKKTKIGFRKE